MVTLAAKAALRLAPPSMFEVATTRKIALPPSTRAVALSRLTTMEGGVLGVVLLLWQPVHEPARP